MPRYKIVNTIFLMVIIFMISLDWQRNIDWKAYAFVIFIFVAIQIYGTLYMSAGFFMPAIFYGNEETKCIAITFDDGPNERTGELLSILKDHQVEACFFCIGKNIEKHPTIVKQLHDDGHIIGNHSFQHGWNFDFLSSKKMKEEFKRTDDAIEKIIKERPNLIRPPYGVTNPAVANAIGNDYKTIGWSIRSFDTVIKDPKKLMKRVSRNLKGGDIVLFHDHSEVMLKILPEFIKYVHSIGLNIVRIDQLLGENSYTKNI